MSFWYLATPYSKYPNGIESAFDLACIAAGLFVLHRVPVYSPIAHAHPIAKASHLNPYDHKLWLPADTPFMVAATGLVVLKAVSWDKSFGIQKEIEAFAMMAKPIFFMDLWDIPEEVLNYGG